MERYAIEIETTLGWTNFHSIMRPGIERARTILAELRAQYPTSKFRIVRWVGEAVPEE